MTRAIALDIGGTKTAAALVAGDGTISVRRSVPTPAAIGPDAVLDAVGALIGEVLAAGGDAELGGVDGVGIGTAGAVDTGRGRIVSSTDTFRDWVGTDVRAGVAARVPGVETIAVLNDVDAHALGEAWCGAARGIDPVLVVAVGTGVGGAIVRDGRLWTGAHHLAGEIAHIPTPGAEGLRCPCGRDGHLEALAAGAAIERRFRAATGEPVAARQIVARAQDGDGEARRLIAEAAAGLGHALAGLITTLDPAGVVVGGGVAEAGPVWWEPFLATCRADLVDALAATPIVPAQLGGDAPLLGAARAVFDMLTEKRSVGRER